MSQFICCNSCGKKHEDIFSIETNQAYGCSSDLIVQEDNLAIYCHYGSKFDTSKFLVKNQAELKLGAICDECISNSLQSGNLIKDESYDAFGFVEDLWENVPESVKGIFWKKPIDFGVKK